MSVNVLKSYLEGKQVKLPTNISIAFEFMERGHNFSIIKKSIQNNLQENKYLISSKDEKFKSIFNFKNGNNDLFELTTNNKNLGFFNINYINKFFESKIFEEKIFNKINCKNNINNANYTIVIIGLDLLSFDNILNFYAFYGRKFQSFPALVYFMSLDYSSENMSEYCEKKKNYIKSKVQIISTEKTKKNNSAKNQMLVLNEITNISKLTKDIGIFEFNLISNNKNPLETLELDKLSIYLKEHKDIFESKAEEAKEEPSSTFKLTLNDNELQAKNETMLPYLKNASNQNKDNIIQIDQEDLNELYEEDPDGDLDI